MPRIPESELEHLKAEVALERLIEARGIVLKRNPGCAVCGGQGGAGG